MRRPPLLLQAPRQCRSCVCVALLFPAHFSQPCSVATRSQAPPRLEGGCRLPGDVGVVKMATGPAQDTSLGVVTATMSLLLGLVSYNPALWPDAVNKCCKLLAKVVPEAAFCREESAACSGQHGQCRGTPQSPGCAECRVPLTRTASLTASAGRVGRQRMCCHSALPRRGAFLALCPLSRR